MEGLGDVGTLLPLVLLSTCGCLPIVHSPSHLLLSLTSMTTGTRTWCGKGLLKSHHSFVLQLSHLLHLKIYLILVVIWNICRFVQLHSLYDTNLYFIFINVLINIIRIKIKYLYIIWLNIINNKWWMITSVCCPLLFRCHPSSHPRPFSLMSSFHHILPNHCPLCFFRLLLSPFLKQPKLIPCMLFPNQQNHLVSLLEHYVLK